MNDTWKLNDAQRELVEHYLSVVDWVILDYIKVNPQVCGLDRSDVYQEGCYHLCRAAASYAGEPEGFGAYARKVVRNGLISYCRQICRHDAPLPLLTEEIDGSGGSSQDSESTLEQAVIRKLTGEDLFRTLHQVHRESSGVVRLGIEALVLKANGLSGQEIAAMYGVKPNHVGAWISRAASRLRCSRAFLRACGMAPESAEEPTRRVS